MRKNGFSMINDSEIDKQTLQLRVKRKKQILKKIQIKNDNEHTKKAKKFYFHATIQMSNTF